MSQEPLQTSQIEIGRLGNKIFHDSEGNMCFSDRFVGKVKLIELLDNFSDKPSISVAVSSSDWQFERTDTIYNRSFWYLEYNLVTLGFTNNTKLNIDAMSAVSLSPLILKKIRFDEEILYSNKVKIISSEKINCFLNFEQV